MVSYIKTMQRGVDRAEVLATIALARSVEMSAKRNAIKEFTGRNQRKLTGNLLNSIFSGVEKEGGNLNAFVGTRGIPYGAIHEFGGTITPKKAKNLWIPSRENKRMTPREFMNMRRADPSQFFLNSKVAGRVLQKKPLRIMPLFFLTKQSVIPERPYLRPAIEVGMDAYPDVFFNFLTKEMTE